ncbi:MAG: hypothetical protein ABJA66_19200 [Actinomycetota bacterium]
MSETYTNLLQWLVILAFFLLVIGAMFAEAFWLSRKGWASFGKSFAFAALSNFISLVVSFVVGFICMIALLPLMFDNTVPNSFQTHIVAITAIGIFAISFTPVFLIICKRIFLAILKMQTGKTAWLYALVSSILILVIAFGITMVAGYFAFN